MHGCEASWQACLENPLTTHHPAAGIPVPTLCHPLDTEKHKMSIVGWFNEKMREASRLGDLWAGIWNHRKGALPGAQQERDAKEKKYMLSVVQGGS